MKIQMKLRKPRNPHTQTLKERVRKNGGPVQREPRPAPVPAKAETELQPCAVCEKRTVPKSNYCFGCKAYICDACDTGNAPWGAHNPFEHTNEMEEG